jgi:hypothetical protein
MTGETAKKLHFGKASNTFSQMNGCVFGSHLTNGSKLNFEIKCLAN